MSAETFAAMEAAIAAHVADDLKDDGTTILTGWVMQCTTSKADPEFIDSGLTGFVRYVPDNQSMVTSLGIIDYTHHMIRVALTQHEIGDSE